MAATSTSTAASTTSCSAAPRLADRKDNLDYFFTGQYLQTQLGVEPPTPGPSAYHDQTYQGQGFSYLSYFLSPTQRLSLISGFAINHFEIPNNPNQPQVYQLAGVPFYPSVNINDNQLEQNYYGVLAWQGALGDKFDYQLAGFSRYSTLGFYPDNDGDLIYNGAASRIFRSSWVNGLQGDSSYRLNDSHTIRAGFYFSGERAEIDNHELVFDCSQNPAGTIACGSGPGFQTTTSPSLIVDDRAITAWLYGVYIQDEWRPTEQLTINYGARFDLYDGIVRADQASPRVGMVYKPFKKTTLHAAYARYFAPPPTELIAAEAVTKFAGTTGAPPSPFSSNPSPERSHYFDVGALQELLPGLNVGIDSYFKLSSDLIDEGQFGPAIIFSTFNYNRGRVYGTEFTGSYNRGNLTTYANFAYSVAQGEKVVSGQIQFRPRQSWRTSPITTFSSITTRPLPRRWARPIDGTGSTFCLMGCIRAVCAKDSRTPATCPITSRQISAPPRNSRCPKWETWRPGYPCLICSIASYQIRSGTGIGVFAPQYGPRRALYAGLKWEIPFLKAPPVAQTVN